MIVSVNSLVGISLVALLLGLLFPSLRPLLISPREGLSRAAHIVAAVPILYLALVAFVFWLKANAKRKKLEKLDVTLARVNETRSFSLPIATIVQPPEIPRVLVEATLRDLLETLDQSKPFLLYLGGKPPLRTAWIYLPDANGTLRAVHVHGWTNEYREVALLHRPAMLTQASVDALEIEYKAKAATLQTRAFDAWREKTYLPELWKSSSLTGWAYTLSGAFAFGNAQECPYFDASYLSLIPEEDRERCQFRSCAGVRLELGSKPFGVLMLFDSAKFAFGEKDALPIRIYGALLSQFVGDAIASGHYTPTDQSYHV